MNQAPTSLTDDGSAWLVSNQVERILTMKLNRFTEQELLEGMDPLKAHADELAMLLQQELTPLERLRGSASAIERPFDSCWEDDTTSD